MPNISTTSQPNLECSAPVLRNFAWTKVDLNLSNLADSARPYPIALCLSVGAVCGFLMQGDELGAAGGGAAVTYASEAFLEWV